MSPDLFNLLAARDGHFRYESGYHSDLWLDLDLLLLHPRTLHPFVSELAAKLARYQLEAICGPLVGGALVAQMIAAELNLEFYYTERFVRAQQGGLYPVEYRLPAGLRPAIRNKKVAIVDDVISAGSAVRGTLTDLRTHSVGRVVFGALLVLGNATPQFCAEHHIPLESVAARASNLWLPADCPLCLAGKPLEDMTNPTG